MANFAFFGSPWFAAIILDKLIAGGFVPSLVITNPDRPFGRKKVLTAPAVKTLIANRPACAEASAGKQSPIEVLQPEKLDYSLLATRYSLPFDFFIVATYGKIIPKSVYSLPRLGTIGVHHSLLPRHRGPTPVQSAILAGDEEAGTSLFLMNEKIDEGKIIAQRKSPIANRNYEELETTLSELSGELLVKTLPDFIAGKIKPVAQDESKATYTKKFATQDAFIEEKDLAAAESGDMARAAIIARKIRALNPEPGTWTMRSGKRVKLLEAEIENGKLVLKKIQVEGGKPQSI